MNVLVLNPPSQKIKNIVRDLIYGCWCGGKRIGGMQMPPLNLLYAATVLKQDGHHVTFLDGSVDEEQYKRVKQRFKDFKVVAILSSTNSFQADVNFLKEIKIINPAIVSVLFGSHPTFMAKHCLREECVDIIVRREPEFILRNLVNAIEKGKELKEVKGIGYREKEDVIFNDVCPFIENLDELPMPDRDLLPEKVDYFNPVIKRMPYTTMQTSRGCPARCNFCTVPSFYGKKIRYRSAESVLRELKILSDRGYKEIFFRDETFSAYKERNREICEGIFLQGLDLTWICNARVDMIDKEDLTLMKRAGCHLVKFGVESGNQEILENIRKGITVEQTRQAFAICHELRIDSHAHVMLGCPGETNQTIEKTLAFIKEIDPTFVSFGIHTPYPGTELFAEVAIKHPEIQDGTDASMDKLHIKGFFNESFTNLKKEELEAWIKKAYRAIYFRPSYLFKRLRSIQSFSEFMRLVIAGSNIFSFATESEKE